MDLIGAQMDCLVRGSLLDTLSGRENILPLADADGFDK